MSTNPLVSLIVPCYNVAHLCDRFFDSLLRQTYTHIQLIFVNDGSTDNTEQRILSYQQILEKKGFLFEYYFQQNKGLGGAINTGLKKVQGEYFCWADSDDFFEDDAFEVRVDYFESHPNCMILTCDANTRMSDNILDVVNHQCDYFVHHKDPNQFLYLLDYDSVFCAGTHMIRTDAFKRVNQHMDIYESRIGQDMQLLLPMYFSYERDWLPNIVYNYIVYNNSMSHSSISYEQKNKKIEEQLRIEIETLKRIDMPIEERDRYIRHAEVFHKKMQMYNARAYNKRGAYRSYYLSLKKHHKIDFKDRLRRMRFLLIGR